ncbi:MAG: oxidoreductase [Candidatus Poribacteria bacterium]|nr:MAG: oxidoreductase [Candidatus Poribacteria bacterium]
MQGVWLPPEPEIRHSGRVVLISGGVRGIGRALTDGFLGAGARVVVFHRGVSEESQQAEALLRRDHAQAMEEKRLLLLRADLTDPGDRRRVLERTEEAFGRLDVLINNAGVCYRTDLTPERIAEQERINADAPLAFSEEAATLLRRNESFSPLWPTRGAILGISSYVTEWKEYPSEYLRYYAASKRKLEQGLQELARRLRRDDINVNVIAVGVVYAGMGLATIGRKEEQLRAGQLPVTKFAHVDAVVFEALVLSHPRAHYKTGRIEVLDGGWNLGPDPTETEKSSSA